MARIVKHLSSVAAAAACLLAALPAAAQTKPCCRDVSDNWYASVSGQLTFLQGYAVHDKFAPGGFNSVGAEMTFNPGYGLGGALGYRLAPGIRTELEVMHYVSSIDTQKGVNNTPLPAGSHYSGQQTTTIMANLFGEYHNDSLLTPYIGGGIGAMRLRAPLFVQITNLSGTVVEEYKLQDWVLGYQFMAGVSRELPDFITSKSEIVLGYRFVGGQEGEAKSKTIPGLSNTFEHASHNVELGLRVYF